MSSRTPPSIFRWVSLLLPWLIGPLGCSPAGSSLAQKGDLVSVEASDPAPTEAVYAALVDESRKLLASLSPQLRARAVLPPHDPHRTRGFCYTLAQCREDYRGVRVAELGPEQRVLLQGVLVRALSSQGYEKVKAIMNRERILQEMEDAHRADPAHVGVVGSPATPSWKPPLTRDAESYTLAFYGEPGEESGWALRFEGHHVSVNLGFKRVDGKLTASVWPSFFGVSPMIIPAAPAGGHFPRWRAEEGQQVMRKEVVLARTFARALGAEARKRAAWPTIPAAELEGGTDVPLDPRAHDRSGAGPGVTFRELDPTARALLWDFVREFVRNQEPRFVDSVALVESLARAKVHYIGDLADDFAPFYLRVETGRFLLELLQSDNYGVKSEVNANHVHATFRDLTSDFDADVSQAQLTRLQQPGTPPQGPTLRPPRPSPGATLADEGGAAKVVRAEQ